MGLAGPAAPSPRTTLAACVGRGPSPTVLRPARQGRVPAKAARFARMCGEATRTPARSAPWGVAVAGLVRTHVLTLKEVIGAIVKQFAEKFDG